MHRRYGVLVGFACWLCWGMVFAQTPRTKLVRNTSPCAIAYKANAPGVLDLRRWHFTKQGPAKLSGPWLVYWKQLLTPASVCNATPTGTLRIPTPWGGRTLNGTKLQSDGYATYRLIVRLPHQTKQRPTMALRLNRLYSAYRLYVNGTLQRVQGRVGTTQKTSSMRGGPALVSLSVPKGQQHLELIVQIANFFHRKGGPSNPIYLGTHAQLNRDRTLRIGYDLVLFATLFVIGFFYLILHILLRQSAAILYFSLASLCFGLRLLLVNESFLLYLIPQLPYPTLLRIEYILSYLICLFSVLFLHHMFPKESSPRTVRLLQYTWFVAMLSPLLLSTWLFTRMWWVLFVSILATAGFAAFVIAKALLKQREGARVLLLGNLLVIVGSIYDAWGYNNAAGTHIEITQLCLMTLIIGQAMFLAQLFSSAFVTVERLAKELEQKNDHLTYMNKAASRFVPDDLLVLLGKDNIAEVQLSDYVHKQMAIMFSDIRGFTTISEAMTAAENFAFVNAVMGRLSPIIRSHNGFVIKYLGDGMMAVFPGGVEDALAAANAKLAAVAAYNSESKEQPRLQVGIGINYGSMMLGMVGELSRLQGDVLADAVNLAARVEGMTKRYQVDLLITDSAYQALASPDEYHIRELDRVKPKGKSNPVTVYEVFDCDEEERIQAKTATKKLLEQSIIHYREQDFLFALQSLREAQKRDPDDLVIALYIERCQRRMREGKTVDWDGVEVLNTK